MSQGINMPEYINVIIKPRIVPGFQSKFNLYKASSEEFCYNYPKNQDPLLY
jgi:hypothetical protein